MVIGASLTAYAKNYYKKISKKNPAATAGFF